jgi:hypothetical protein
MEENNVGQIYGKNIEFEKEIIKEELVRYPNESINYRYYVLVDKKTKNKSMIMCEQEHIKNG